MWKDYTSMCNINTINTIIMNQLNSELDYLWVSSVEGSQKCFLKCTI